MLRGAKDILIKIAGDNSSFKKSVKGAEDSMSGFSTSIKKYAAGAALAFAGIATSFAIMATKMASAEEVVNRQTESLLKSQGIMWSTVNEELTNYINNLEGLTAYGDTDLQLAFNKMIASGMSYTQALNSMNAATDLAYSQNISLEASAQMLSDAYNGKASRLEKLGITYDTTTDSASAYNDVLGQIDEKMADASDRTDTLNGKMESLQNTADDAAEAFGARLIPEISAFTDGVIEAGGGTEELFDFLGKLAVMPITLPRLSGGHAANMITINKLRKSGIDTEEEFVNLLRLEGEELGVMSDAEFNRKQAVLVAAGYYEKSLQIDKERNYVLKQQEITEKNRVILAAQLLEIEKAITDEGVKQTSTMRERAALAQAEIENKRGFRSNISGTTQMSATTAKILGYGSERVSSRITGGESTSSNNSGV